MQDLIRNLLIFTVVVIAISLPLSFLRVNLVIRNLRGSKEDIFHRLLAVLNDHQFKVISVDPIHRRILVEAIVKVNDLELYPVWAKRVAFKLTELSDEKVQIRAYAYGVFLAQYLYKSEKARAMNWRKISEIIDELVRG